MVSKITIFEPHFDGAQFGSTTLDSSESTAQSQEGEDDQSGIRGRTIVGTGSISLGILIVLLVVRRVKIGALEDVEIEGPSVGEADPQE